MKVDQKLVDAALTFLDKRHPDKTEGGVAAMYTETGKILLSTYAETPNEGAGLCHETGAICEAHKLNERIAATVCVSRLVGAEPIFLPPCGMCQERLAFWGSDVSAAVPKNVTTPTEWKAVTLS
jgi:cytidine deaminase